VCGLMGLARLVELRQSRRNVASQGAGSEGEMSHRSYPAMVVLHTVAIVGTLVLGQSRPRWGWLLLLLAMQPLRWWVLMTLGRRWNARGSVPEELSVATDGPYALVRHPNYGVVLVELAALPAAFGLERLAAVSTAVNVALLTLRIRDEESLLLRHEAYRAHFGDKPRFLPGLF
jgi:methyltransferase